MSEIDPVAAGEKAALKYRNYVPWIGAILLATAVLSPLIVSGTKALNASSDLSRVSIDTLNVVPELRFGPIVGHEVVDGDLVVTWKEPSSIAYLTSLGWTLEDDLVYKVSLASGATKLVTTALPALSETNRRTLTIIAQNIPGGLVSETSYWVNAEGVIVTPGGLRRDYRLSLGVYTHP